MEVERVVELSDTLLKSARESCQSVYRSKHGLLEYETRVKSSIALLLSCSCGQSARWETIVNYKLARVYFEETENLELAMDRITRAISHAKRVGDQALLMETESLYLDISFKQNREQSLRVWESQVDNIALKFVALQYVRVSRDHSEYQNRLSALMAELGDEDNRQLFAVCLVYKLNDEIAVGDMGVARKTLTRLRGVIDKTYPVQIRAMFLLAQLMVSLVECDQTNSKAHISQLDQFYKNQKAKGFPNWNSNRFTVSVECVGKTVPLQIDWMTCTEFSILTFFYCGLSYLLKTWDKRQKAATLFKMCHHLIEKEMGATVACSLGELEFKMLKLRYWRVLLNFYEALDCFNSGDTDLRQHGRFKPLFEFIRNYESGQFSSQELAVYHKLIPNIFYLQALENHVNGNYEIAKRYYTKVRKTCTATATELNNKNFVSDDAFVSLRQLFAGAGAEPPLDWKNHLYCLSTLNLYVLNCNDLIQFKGKDKSNAAVASRFDKALKLRRTLLADLARMCNNTNFAHFEPLVMGTLGLLNNLNWYGDTGKIQKINVLTLRDRELARINAVAPYLGSVIYCLKAVSPKTQLDENETPTQRKLRYLVKSYELWKLTGKPDEGQLGSYVTELFMETNFSSDQRAIVRELWQDFDKDSLKEFINEL